MTSPPKKGGEQSLEVLLLQHQQKSAANCAAGNSLIPKAVASIPLKNIEERWLNFKRAPMQSSPMMSSAQQEETVAPPQQHCYDPTQDLAHLPRGAFSDDGGAGDVECVLELQRMIDERKALKQRVDASFRAELPKYLKNSMPAAPILLDHCDVLDEQAEESAIARELLEIPKKAAERGMRICQLRRRRKHLKMTVQTLDLVGVWATKCKVAVGHLDRYDFATAATMLGARLYSENHSPLLRRPKLMNGGTQPRQQYSSTSVGGVVSQHNGTSATGAAHNDGGGADSPKALMTRRIRSQTAASFSASLNRPDPAAVSQSPPQSPTRSGADPSPDPQHIDPASSNNFGVEGVATVSEQPEGPDDEDGEGKQLQDEFMEWASVVGSGILDVKVGMVVLRTWHDLSTGGREVLNERVNNVLSAQFNSELNEAHLICVLKGLHAMKCEGDSLRRFLLNNFQDELDQGSKQALINIIGDQKRESWEETAKQLRSSELEYATISFLGVLAEKYRVMMKVQRFFERLAAAEKERQEFEAQRGSQDGAPADDRDAEYTIDPELVDLGVDETILRQSIHLAGSKNDFASNAAQKIFANAVCFCTDGGLSKLGLEEVLRLYALFGIFLDGCAQSSKDSAESSARVHLATQCSSIIGNTVLYSAIESILQLVNVENFFAFPAAPEDYPTLLPLSPNPRAGDMVDVVGRFLRGEVGDVLEAPVAKPTAPPLATQPPPPKQQPVKKKTELDWSDEDDKDLAIKKKDTKEEENEKPIIFTNDSMILSGTLSNGLTNPFTLTRSQVSWRMVEAHGEDGAQALNMFALTPIFTQSSNMTCMRMVEFARAARCFPSSSAIIRKLMEAANQVASVYVWFIIVHFVADSVDVSLEDEKSVPLNLRDLARMVREKAFTTMPEEPGYPAMPNSFMCHEWKNRSKSPHDLYAAKERATALCSLDTVALCLKLCLDAVTPLLPDKRTVLSFGGDVQVISKLSKYCVSVGLRAVTLSILPPEQHVTVVIEKSKWDGNEKFYPSTQPGGSAAEPSTWVKTLLSQLKETHDKIKMTFRDVPGGALHRTMQVLLLNLVLGISDGCARVTVRKWSTPGKKQMQVDVVHLTSKIKELHPLTPQRLLDHAVSYVLTLVHPTEQVSNFAEQKHHIYTSRQMYSLAEHEGGNKRREVEIILRDNNHEDRVPYSLLDD